MGVLNRVFKPDKKVEIMAILKSRNPSHNQRLWMVGFLKYACGYSNQEVCNIIRLYNCWEDYNPSITEYQVESVKKSRGGVNLLD